jgi:hypothetical protein
MNQNYPRPSLAVANYSSALARALDWLGDRYRRRTGRGKVV